MGCSKSSFKREVYSNTIIPQETRQISNNLTLHLKQLEKEWRQQQQNAKLVEINYKDQSRNEKEMKKLIVKTNKTKS